MDIRNFFGEKKGVNAVATVVEDIPKPMRRKTIVNDDDSDTESPSELVSTSTETLTTKSESSKSPARPSVKLTAKPSAKPTAKPSAKPSALFQPAKSKQPVVESETVRAAVAVAVVASAQPSSLSPVASTVASSSSSASSSTVSNGKIDGPDETTASTSELPADIETKVVDAVVASVKSKGVGLTAVSTDFSDIITWKAGESIPYLALVNTFEAISKISGRLEKEIFFCRLFRAIISTTPSELDAIVHLASNSVGPAYEGLELGIGDSLLVKAVCEATGRKKDAVEEDYEREGDLGTVALLSRNSQKTLSFAAKPKPLHAVHVLEMLRAITRTKGERAQGRKVDIIKGIMVKCQGSEAKYIVRALQGKLRIGTAEQTVLVALAHSFASSSYSGPKSSSIPSSVSVAVKGQVSHNEDEVDEDEGEDENENEEENVDEVEIDKKNGKSNKSEKQKMKELSRDQEGNLRTSCSDLIMQLLFKRSSHSRVAIRILHDCYRDDNNDKSSNDNSSISSRQLSWISHASLPSYTPSQ
jgi:DNA ligase N terminus